MVKQRLKIEFGVPKHGWLPVVLTSGDFSLQFVASDVPANPVDQLISSLRQILKGIRTEVWWHLEPEGYYMEFDRLGDEYKIRISFAKSDSSDRKIIYELNGNFESVILPFYRVIKKFCTQHVDSSNWPKTDESEVESLSEIIRTNKLNTTIRTQNQGRTNFS